MDLAEIRKKARADLKAPAPQGGRTETSVLRNPCRKQSAVPPSATDETPSSEVSIPLRPALSLEETVDALFRTPLETEGVAENSDLHFLHRSEEDDEENQRQLLTFSLGSEDYALDINCIREIIKPREITDIPRVPEFILGIISLRGIIIPVFDLRRRLKLGAGEEKPTSRIIVCQQEEKIVGLLVDGISQVIRVPTNSIEPPPAVLSGLDRDMVEGVGRNQGRMTILLRLSCVMDAELI